MGTETGATLASPEETDPAKTISGGEDTGDFSPIDGTASDVIDGADSTSDGLSTSMRRELDSASDLLAADIIFLRDL